MKSEESQLNLPSYPPLRSRLSPTRGVEEVWDTQRKRWVKLTPEEWVRQHFVHWLIDGLSYPAGCIGNEIQIKVGKLERRCDSVVFGRDGLPKMIIEYKAPTVTLTQKVFDQIARYNIALQVDYLVVSNGRQHYCCRLDRETLHFDFLQSIPPFQSL